MSMKIRENLVLFSQIQTDSILFYAFLIYTGSATTLHLQLALLHLKPNTFCFKPHPSLSKTVTGASLRIRWHL